MRLFLLLASSAAVAVVALAATLSACADESNPADEGEGSGDGGPSAEGDGAAKVDAAATDASADAHRPLGPPRLYVGSTDGKIRVHAFDPTTHAITELATVDAGSNPSFLAMDAATRFLYAVDEGGDRVNAFTVGDDGRLSLLQDVASGGGGPTHVGLDRAGRHVMVANYGGGSVTVFPRGSDGRLGAAVTRSFGGGAQSHQIVTDPGDGFAFVPNKGRDAVAVLRLADPSADAGVYPAGDGARHIDFHPSGRFAYVINELDDTVSAYALEPSTGALTAIAQVPTLPDGTSGASNTGAEIQVLPDGQHLIVSNRGDDSLMVMNIRSSDGVPSRATRVASGGRSPRHFSVDETGTFLFVANENSNNVVVMRIEPSTGVPSPVGEVLDVPSPKFARLYYLQR